MPPANSSAVDRSWISLALKRCICTRQAPAAGCSWLPAVSALPAPGRARQHAVPPAAKRCVQLPLGGSLCVSAGMPANAVVLGGSVVPWIPLLDRQHANHCALIWPALAQRGAEQSHTCRTSASVCSAYSSIGGSFRASFDRTWLSADSLDPAKSFKPAARNTTWDGGMVFVLLWEPKRGWAVNTAQAAWRQVGLSAHAGRHGYHFALTCGTQLRML